MWNRNYITHDQLRLCLREIIGSMKMSLFTVVQEIKPIHCDKGQSKPVGYWLDSRHEHCVEFSYLEHP